METAPRIKVKLWGRYRVCHLLKVGSKGLNVRVYVPINEQVTGMNSEYTVPVDNVRKADRHVCVPGATFKLGY